MTRKKGMEFKIVAKSFGYTAGGFAGLCVCTMAGFEMLPKSGVDFEAAHYALPFFFGPALGFGVVAIEGALSLAEQTRLGRWASKVNFPTVGGGIPAIRPPITHRAISMSSSGQKRGNVFMKTFPFFPNKFIDINKTINVKNELSHSPDYHSRTVDHNTWLDAEAFEWTVWLTGRVSPIKRESPIVIPENQLAFFLSEIWERQQNRATKTKAMSRPWFTEQQQVCSIPEYYAMVVLIGHSIWGRGGGKSGVLMHSPERVMGRTKATYPNYSTITA